ncbi:sensor histidine kinase [Paenibacillus methanolicus]|nr:histidine kinase [Paenibacillus methanolicus]
MKRIRMKIFLAMLLTTALPLAITASIILYQVDQQIDRDQQFAENRITRDLKGKIEEFSVTLSETAYQIYSNPDLIESIALGKEFLTDSRTYDTHRDIHEFFLNVYNQSRVKNILGMYLLRLGQTDLLGNFFPNIYPHFDASDLTALQRDIKRQDYAPSLKVIYSSPYREPIAQFLYTVRYRGEPAGLLVIDLSEKTFREMTESYNTFYRGQISILKPDHTIVYGTEPTRTGQPFTRQNGAYRVSIQTELASSSWMLNYTYEIHPEQLFYQRIAFVMIAVAFLLAVVFSLWLSFNITKPIIQMHRQMIRIQIGDYSGRVEVKTKDEIGFLGNQFNAMTERMEQLIEHDLKLRLVNQETQIKALQAQISPHFLFNTLQMMAGIAEVNRVPELKLICQSLSHMYRYNMNIENEWVNLRDEVMHIRNYLVIINKRFPGVIRVRFDLDPGTMEARIPKLILQPIVENAVEHGLIPHLGERKLIKITARISPSEHCLYLSVIDNGVGLDEKELDAIRKMLYHDRRSGDKEKGSIGLHNVHSRIRLICGDEYGFQLKSRKGRGSWVIYRLPLRKEE